VRIFFRDAQEGLRVEGRVGGCSEGIQRIETNLVPLYKRDIMERSARSGGVFESCAQVDEESCVDFPEFVKLGFRLAVELSFIGPNPL
jgi:hypothetical protein